MKAKLKNSYQWNNRWYINISSNNLNDYKNFEIKNYIGKKSLFLVYGENNGLKEDIISKFLVKYSKENIFKYTEKEILGNLDDFYNNILSRSFFEDKKLIIIEDVSEKFKKEIDCIIEKNIWYSLYLISKSLEKNLN